MECDCPVADLDKRMPLLCPGSIGRRWAADWCMCGKNLGSESSCPCYGDKFNQYGPWMPTDVYLEMLRKTE